MSERRSTRSPRACSGDMYESLPLMVPATVSFVDRSLRATPKSMTFTSPSREIMMFCGERSRWTTPSGLPSLSESVWA